MSWPTIRLALVTLLGVAVLLGIVWGAHRMLVHNSQFLTAASDPVQYVTGNLINVLIILAVLLQVVIYFTMATQNERLIKASEASANVAREAFHVGEAPYFGIAKTAPAGVEGEAGIYFQVTFVNGGKTPAWHFHSKVRAVVGNTIDDGLTYDLEADWYDLENTFFQTNDSRTFGYKHPLFRYSPELDKRLKNKDVQIFVVIKVHYSDFRKVWHSHDFRLVWDPTGRNLRDYDVEERSCGQCIEQKLY